MMRSIKELQTPRALCKREQELMNIVIQNSTLGLGRAEISVYQDLQTLKKMALY